MKKIMALLLGVVMLFSAFAAGAKVPEFLNDNYNNYTADYTTGVQFKGAEEISALLQEIGMDEEITRHVDIGTLIEGLLNSESTVNIQCNMSEDYKKIDLAMTTEAKQKIAVNTNLNADVTYGGGLWVHTDFTLDEPEFEIIYRTPIHEKYAVVNVMDYISREDVTKAYELFKSVFSPEIIDGINEAGTETLVKYADVSRSGNKYTIHFDNQSFIKMYDELMDLIMDELFAAVENIPEEYGVEISAEMKEELEFPVLDTLEILGKNGITWVFELSPQGKIRTCSLSADIDLNIAKIYTGITGEDWEYSTEGKLAFDVTTVMDITNIGKTKPDFPVLTEENSYTSTFWDDLLYTDYYYDYGPDNYVGGYMDSEVVRDGLCYFPLEEVMSKCYGSDYASEMSDGVTTMESMYFKDIAYVTVSVGSDMAYTDLAEHYIGEVLEIDKTVYVSEKFFADVLGWELTSYSVDLIEGEVYYHFYTDAYEYFEEYYDDDDEEYYFEYPYDYSWGMYDGFEEINGVYYVPLRSAIENAYDDTVNIVYSNGTVTMDSEWFDAFGKITFDVGDTVAYADETPYPVGEIKLIDGNVYVSIGFFEDIFGWILEAYSYDRVHNETTYEFYTNNK